MMPGVCIFSSPSVPFFPSSFCPPLHGDVLSIALCFSFFSARKRGGEERRKRDRERERRGRRARQCPSEKSINLTRGLANVRTIRQRADWGGRGEWDSWRSRGTKEGVGEIRVPNPCQVNAAASSHMQ